MQRDLHIITGLSDSGSARRRMGTGITVFLNTESVPAPLGMHGRCWVRILMPGKEVVAIMIKMAGYAGLPAAVHGTLGYVNK
ncbi:MAG: hypothetical protein ACYDDA_10420 [Acidiferrobacteraceae bacterium]